MTTRRLLRRSTLSAAVLLALMPPAFAADYIFSGGNYVPGATAPDPLVAGDVLQINAGGNKFFDGATLTNQSGTVNWNADTLYMQSGALIDNRSLWDAKGDNSLAYNGGATATFNNSGIFRKSGGAGNTTIGGIAFVNSGTIDAQSGTILFNGNNVTFNAGSQFTGAGSTTIAGNASFNGAFTSANLTLASGTFNGGAARLQGNVAFTGGALAGTWEVAAGHTLSGRDGGNKFLSGDTTVLTNKGTIDWASGNTLYMQSGATLANQGLFVANESMAMAYNGGAAVTFNNEAGGTVRAAAGKTLTVGGVAFVNNGGTLDAAAGGSIVYAGNNATFNGGTQFTGAGSNVVTGNATFSGQFDAGNLSLQSGTFQGVGAVVNGNALFTGGSLGGAWEVAAGHTLSGRDGGNKFLSGDTTVLTNRGTIDWASGNTFYLQSGATLINRALFVASESSTLAYNGGATVTFINEANGTLRAAAGKTLTVGAIAFVNSGGKLNAAAGGSIVYAGNNATFNAGSRFTGLGSNVVTANAVFNGQFDAGNLTLQSGSFQGVGAVVNGNALFTGGSLGGAWEVAAGHTLSGRDGGNKFLNGDTTVLTNKGSIEWGTGNALYMQSGATLINQALFLGSESSSLVYNGGATPTFNNGASGTVRAAAGKTLTVGGIAFNNNGGRLDAELGGSIVYAGNAAQFNDGTRFTGAGANVVTANARFVDGFSSENLRLQSGTFTGGDGVTLGSKAALTQGTAVFTGGTLAGAWQVNAGATLEGAGGGNKFISGGTLTNLGTVAWKTTDALYFQSAGNLANAGTIDLQADSAMLYNGGAAGSFINTGLIVKTGGSGTSTLGNNLGFDNQGVIDVATGTIRLPDNFTNNGTLKGAGAFTTNVLTNAGHVAPGSSPGTLTLNGNYVQTAGGFLDTELASSALFDTFLINGTAALGGTLALSCMQTCDLHDGDMFTILDATGDLTGTFAATTGLNFGKGFEYSVIYDYNADLVKLQVIHAGVVPEPETWALMLAGLAGIGTLTRRRTPG